MPEQTRTPLEAETERLLKLLDAMEFDALGAMLADDIQCVDEITRGWIRGRPAIDAYLEQLRNTVSDLHSHARDLHTSNWEETGIVTFVLEQTYKLGEAQQTLEAPTSIVFRRHRDGWRIALLHTVPLAPETNP